MHAPIQADLDALEERISSLGIDLRAAFDRVIRYRTLQAEIAAHDIEHRSLNEQIEKLRSSLKGLSVEDRGIIARQSVYEAEQRVVQSLERDANVAKQALAAAASELKRLPTGIDTRNMTENGERLQQTHTTLAIGFPA